ncbi:MULTISPECIES: hypothetical protein [Vibrio]|uniref:hypothetical protein n=1 Tax=Vibrio TaxID=662 RepID=UPI0004DF0F5B|nr:hypothetical protein [Vibrio parahaemolyticus]EGQ9239979.1 hypothetical protein [Vibrio vulnificus]EHD1697947.1 hypothetical protein [Vibrio vulnificus]EKZ9225746.1 hypothetical protein [Vibrio vulnificus]ELC9582592.1 hypothetical protein [Vibrio vulnificus]MCU8150247.1 hypothetical protein [Vibrio vulnificus]
MSTTAEKLLAKLKQEPELLGLINDDVVCDRNYPSGSARNAGAWSWELRHNNPPIGSQWSMSECLKSSKLNIWKDPHINFYHVDPVDSFKRKE